MKKKKGSQSKSSLTAPQPIRFSDFEYLYQIGVSKNQTRSGIGSKLLEKAKTSTDKNLLTDVLIDPVSNDASLSFFQSNGFKEAGLLELDKYRSFGKLKSKVLTWSNPDLMKTP